MLTQCQAEKGECKVKHRWCLFSTDSNSLYNDPHSSSTTREQGLKAMLVGNLRTDFTLNLQKESALWEIAKKWQRFLHTSKYSRNVQFNPLSIIWRFYTASETYVGIRIMKTLATNPQKFIKHFSMLIKSSYHSRNSEYKCVLVLKGLIVLP